MLENQATYIEGKEAELFSILLRVRYSNRHEVSNDPLQGLAVLTFLQGARSDEYYS